MNVSDMILSRLADAGVDTAFLVFGGAMSELADAFTRQSRMKYVCTSHEQAAIFAAEGYAKAKGVPGVVIVTSGPGGGNIVTGLQNCYYDSVPLVAICGQVSSNLITPPGSALRQTGFQETPMAEIAECITKWADTPLCAAHAVSDINLAISVATNGRPGPVVIDLPLDVQRAKI